MCRVEALMGFVEFTIRAGPAPASASRLTAGCRRADPTHLSYPGSPPGPARCSVSRKHYTGRRRPQVLIPISGDTWLTPVRGDLSVAWREPDHVDARANLDGHRSVGCAGEAVGIGARQTGRPRSDHIQQIEAHHG